MSKPTIESEVVAALTEAAPGRILKKFEADPKVADTWTWTVEATTIVVDTGGEKVTLTLTSNHVAHGADVACSCLLGPRCFHVLAVIHSLPLGGDAPTQDAPPATDGTLEPEKVEIDDEAQAAARIALMAAGRLLERGAAHASLTVSNELLRAVHTARVRGLHRLAAAGLRVAESIRMHRESSPGFDRDRLMLEFRELIRVAHRLAQPGADVRGFVGTARRQYRDVGSLKLTGVMVDPIITKTGYAGVVTYLMDAQGAFWTLSDVAPGNASRALGAYDGGVSIGDVKSSPKTIARGGLLLQGATGSDDGRLGSGKAVRAVTAKGVPVAQWPVWEVDLADQLARSFEASGQLDRRAGEDLVFFSGSVMGVSGENLLVSELRTGRPILLRAPSMSGALKFVANLKMLGRAPGLVLRVAARRSDDARDGLLAVAAFPFEMDGDEAPMRTLALPDEFGGRVNLGMDGLKPEHVGRLETHPVDLGTYDGPTDPLHAMRQRVASVVQGGRFVFQAGASPQRDASKLHHLMMHAGADYLAELMDAAQFVERDFSGKIHRSDPVRFATAWCAAATYLEAAEVEFARVGLI